MMCSKSGTSERMDGIYAFCRICLALEREAYAEGHMVVEAVSIEHGHV